MSEAAAQPPRAVLADQRAAIESRLAGFTTLAHDSSDPRELHDAMLDLVMELSAHFGYEESLMEAGGFASLEHHRLQHLAMMIELGLLLDRLDNASRLDHVLLRAIDFFAAWYRRHVVSSDRVLNDWLPE